MSDMKEALEILRVKQKFDRGYVSHLMDTDGHRVVEHKKILWFNRDVYVLEISENLATQIVNRKMVADIAHDLQRKYDDLINLPIYERGNKDIKDLSDLGLLIRTAEKIEYTYASKKDTLAFDQKVAEFSDLLDKNVIYTGGAHSPYSVQNMQITSLNEKEKAMCESLNGNNKQQGLVNSQKTVQAVKGNVNLIANDLDLNASAQKKLNQIILMSNNIPVTKYLDIISKNIDKNEFITDKYVYIKDRAFTDYTLSKKQSENSQKTDSVSLQLIDSEPLTVGLPYSDAENLQINNLSQKDVYLTYETIRNYFSEPRQSFKEEMHFSFDKSDNLTAVEITKTQSQNDKPKSSVKTYNAEQIENMLSEQGMEA
ncbi:MAG: hypothetical protein AB7S44_01665 [Spirochaetales bacterium]